MTSALVKTLYRAKDGSRFTEQDAQVIGTALRRLEDEDALEPARVVAEAKAPASPLHSYFEWDEKRAANRYRYAQAREMMRSIYVVTRGAKGNSNIRTFIPVTVQTAPRRPYPEAPTPLRGSPGYEFTQNPEELKRQLLLATRQWRSFVTRYGPYLKISPEFAARFGEIIQLSFTVPGLADDESTKQL